MTVAELRQRLLRFPSLAEVVVQPGLVVVDVERLEGRGRVVIVVDR